MNRLLAVVGLAALMACGGGNGASDVPTGPTSLQIEDVVVGTGPTVVAGDTITINYVGTFLDGRVFDQSPAGQPVTFPRPIGVGNFIPGFDQGVLGMKVGGRLRPHPAEYAARVRRHARRDRRQIGSRPPTALFPRCR